MFKNIAGTAHVEDGIKAGGFGSAVLEWMNDNGYHPDIKRLGLPDHFVEHGSQLRLRELVGLRTNNIAEAMLEMVGKK